MRGRVVLVVMMLVSLGPAALAADADETAAGIAQEIMSPFCPGITLHDCPSRAALDLRERIEDWVRAGWSRDRVFDELVAEYGQGILAVPDQPLTPVSRLLPVLAVSGGGLLVWRWINRWQRTRVPDAQTASATPEESAVLDAELDQLRGSE